MIEFKNDSICLYACNKEIGSCEYSISNNEISTELIYIIEICALNGWIEFVAMNISYSRTYSLSGEQLKINSYNTNEYNLILERESTIR